MGSSEQALKRERKMLSKRVQKFSEKERKRLYQKWGIGLKTKRRSLQLAHHIWKVPKDMNHVQESAALVAKLVGFVEPGEAPKEIFGLSFLTGPLNRRSCRWKHSLSLVS